MVYSGVIDKLLITYFAFVKYRYRCWKNNWRSVTHLFIALKAYKLLTELHTPTKQDRYSKVSAHKILTG